MQCRICGNQCMERELVHECRAGGITKLLRHAPYTIKKDNVALYECSNCGHIQTQYLLNQDFYDDYADFNGAIQYYGDKIVLDKQFERLSGYADSASHIIEIGCGEGRALQAAQRYFTMCTGVEPSETEMRIAKKTLRGGVKLICAYFDRSLKLESEYNAFCTFQVFEHLEHVKDVLDYAYDILVDGGVGLINVPNGQQILEQGLYHQIHWEHINYFTPYSLALLCKNAGFDILFLESDYAAIELNIYVKKSSHHISLDACRNNLKQQLHQALSECRTFAVYGAGAKTVSYSDLIEQEKLLHVFDSDQTKAGKYVAGLHLPVEQATRQACAECDAIIIFASSYNREIIAMLTEIGFTGNILYFEGNKLRKIKNQER